MPNPSHVLNDLHDTIKTHLIALSEAHGATGYEDYLGERSIRAVLEQTWRPLTDEITVNRMGNLYATKRANRPRPNGSDQAARRIMLCAHMDEVGFVVRQITPEGFLRVNMLGFPDARIMPGQRALVHGRETLPGVFCVPPAFAETGDTAKKYPKRAALYLDVFLPADEVRALVQPGDMITMDTRVLELKEGRLAGKAMDNRACVAAVTAALHMLQERFSGWDVIAVGTVQEEQTLLGAEVAAYELNPDLCIVLDVTFAKQPGVKPPTFALGGGPTIDYGPNLHPTLTDAIKAAADRANIPNVVAVYASETGTDALVTQITRDGVPTALVEVPLRNMHTTIESIDMKDVINAGAILAEFIAGLPADFLLDPDSLP